MRRSYQPSFAIFDTAGEWAKDRNCYRILKQTALFFQHHLGPLNVWSRKRKYANVDIICIKLIPLNRFLGFPNVFMVFSAYTYQSFFLSVRNSFFCIHVKCCLKVLQFLNPLKVRICLEKSIILNRKEITITEKESSNDPSS